MASGITARASLVDVISEYGVEYTLCVFIDRSDYEKFIMLPGLDDVSGKFDNEAATLVTSTRKNEHDIDKTVFITYPGAGTINDVEWLKNCLTKQAITLQWLTEHDVNCIIIEIIKILITLGKL